jgi:hypothetical protein
MRNGARTVLVLCALAVGVVPLPLGSNGIAVAWAFLGVVFGATFAPTLWRRYGISHRPLQAITGTSLALVGGVAGWALAIASALFVYSLVVAVGGFFLWIPVGRGAHIASPAIDWHRRRSAFKDSEFRF